MMWWRKQTVEEMWAANRPAFLKLLAKENTKKVGPHDLEHRYTDSDGGLYYGFTPDMSIPMERLGKLYYYMELLFKGLSADEDERIDRAMSNALETGLSNPKKKAAALIGSLLMEREKRRRIVIHPELVCNVLAVQLVREDEEVATFSNDIQMQKVEQFRLDAERNGAYPFFQMRELRQLSSFLQLTKDELQQFWNESLIQEKVLAKALKTVYTLGKDSGKSQTTTGQE